MKFGSYVLRPVGAIRGGAKLPHRKCTAELDTAIMPVPKSVIIPLSQHIGATCEPTVSKGDKVYVGTKIGDIDRFVSAPIHSSVSGTVTDIIDFRMARGMHCPAVIIEADGLQTADPSITPPTVENEEQLAAAARECGLVGLGGAGFPTHVKLKKGANPLDTLIINGAECEPYITADYRECLENPRDIFEGVYLLQRILGFERVIIAIEENKPTAIEILNKIATDSLDVGDRVKVMRLKTVYPQGAEKSLIYTTTKRKVPFGKLPADVGCVVMNITSIATLMRYVRTGMPLVSKRLTVDGGAVARPQNVIVPLGVSVGEVLEFCGGLKCTPKKILMGGPMMGFALENTETPVLKQNNAILALDESEVSDKPTVPCIRCGRCVSICPMKLNPASADRAVAKHDKEMMLGVNAGYCIECGSCSYICPSARPLTESMQIIKSEMRRNK